jgi:hypothetical protein
VKENLNHMIYMDDSGRPQNGLAVLGWIDFHPDHWSSVLGQWIETRKLLWREYGIPVRKELHTTAYVNGRDRISKRIPSKYVHDEKTYWKDFGIDVALTCLHTLSSIEGLAIGSSFNQAHDGGIHVTKMHLYEDYLENFELELSRENALGLVFIDGNGNDQIFMKAHRKLARTNRLILEDPIHMNSKHSQFIQMADLVAWTAFAEVHESRDVRFAKNWYSEYLSSRDLSRTPRKLLNSKTP